MCRYCRHRVDLDQVTARVAPEFYAPRADSREERRVMRRKIGDRLRVVKAEQKRLRRDGQPTHVIDFERDLLVWAARVFLAPDGFTRPDGHGHGYYYNSTYDEARAMR